VPNFPDDTGMGIRRSLLVHAALSGVVAGLKVAVVGGGLGGLATAVYLAKSGRVCRVEMIDAAAGPGLGGASAVAAGLMHPWAPRGKFLHKGLEGYSATHAMLDLVRDCTGACVHSQQTILRPCYDLEELKQWTQAADNHPDWLAVEDAEQYSRRLGCAPTRRVLGAALMKRSTTIDTPLYLKARYETVRKFTPDCSWTHRSLTNHEQVFDLCKVNDFVVVASGLGVAKLWPESLSVKYVRGQNLIYSLPITALQHSILSGGEYIIPRLNQSTLLVGATHEHDQISLEAPPDMNVAVDMLSHSIADLYPPLHNAAPVGCEAGVRVVSQRTQLGRVPIIAIGKQHENLWLLSELKIFRNFTLVSQSYLLAPGPFISNQTTNLPSTTSNKAGFGSRGIIHHALFAEQLAKAILTTTSTNLKTQ